MQPVIILLRIVLLYIVAGIVFALFFLWRGAERLDESARNASWKTKILWLPATVLLWPLIGYKWRKLP